MNRVLASMCLLAFLLPVVVFAADLRCGRHLVRVGDTKVDVIRRCGEPFFRQQISGTDERSVEQWFYVPGRTQFQRIVTFQGTRVVRIEIKTP